MLINALMRRNELPAALAAIDKLAPKMQGSPVPDGLRGRIQLARKDNAAAQAAFEVAQGRCRLPAGRCWAWWRWTPRPAASMPASSAWRALWQPAAFGPGPPGAGRAAEADRRAPERVTRVLAAGVREEPTDAGLRLALIDHQLRLGTRPRPLRPRRRRGGLPLNADLLERLARTQLLPATSRRRSRPIRG
jgi:hypothetical protein